MPHPVIGRLPAQEELLKYCYQRLVSAAALAALLVAGVALGSLRELFQNFIEQSHVVLLSLLTNFPTRRRARTLITRSKREATKARRQPLSLANETPTFLSVACQ